MKDQFYKYQAQTSPHPLAVEVVEAKGMYIYDKSGKILSRFCLQEFQQIP